MTQRIYLTHVLLMLMPSDMHKVISTLFSYQKDGEITYSKRNCEFLHLSQDVVERCIQTAIDYKIIEPAGQSGGVWRFKINVGLIEASKQIPLTEIQSKGLFKLSEAVKFREQPTAKERTADEILAEIDALQRELMKTVKTENNGGESLPW